VEAVSAHWSTMQLDWVITASELDCRHGSRQKDRATQSMQPHCQGLSAAVLQCVVLVCLGAAQVD